MALINITELGAVGIIKDTPPYKLPANAWTAGSNIRFNDTVAETTAGHKNIQGPIPSVVPYGLLPWQNVSTYYWFYAGTAKIYRMLAATHTNVTRVSGDYTAGVYPKWTGGVIGGVPVLIHDAMHTNDPPQSWDGSAHFQNMTNWPNAGSPSAVDPWWRCKVLRVFKQYLLALYMSENVGSGAVTYPARLRWSTPADPGTLPTSWLPLSTNLAGSKDFAETTSALVDCLPLGDVNIVYKEDSVHIQQTVAGNDVFAFRQAFSEFGLMTINAVRPFFGKHLVVSRNDIVLHNGGSADSIVSKRYRSFIFNNIDDTNYKNAFVVANTDQHEVWVCVPSVGNTQCDLAHIWNWDDNTWTTIDLPNITYIHPGVIDQSAVSTIINSLTREIDDYTYTIDYSFFNPNSVGLMGAAVSGASGRLYEMDVGGLYGAQRMEATLERTGLAIIPSQVPSGYVVDTQKLKFFRRHFPVIEKEYYSTDSIKISYGVQEDPNSEVVWLKEKLFFPDKDTYIDVNIQGKYLAIKYDFITRKQVRLISHGLDISVVGEI